MLEAADGQEALQIAQEYVGEIHVVLTDVVMPGIKSLFISGYTDNAIVHHGILDSNVAFLQKPFTVESLVRKIRKVLNS